MANQETIQLRAGETTQAFSAAHAKRLLSYPGSLWKELEGEQAAEQQALPEAVEGAGEQEAPATGSRRNKAN